MNTLIIFTLALVSVLADEAYVQLFSYGSRKFTEAVYDEVKVDNNDNFLISPFSLETVLALTQSGAVGTTGQEIRTTLNLPDDQQETDSVLKAVIHSITSKDFSLETANKIYVEENFQIKQQFKDIATSAYQAEFQNIEFAESASSAKEINDWVAEETHDKIQNLVSPDDLNAATRIVLVNALYFKANWSTPFKSLDTDKATFRSAATAATNIDFMNVKSLSVNYYESEDLDATFLELPFVGEEASMTFVLPNKNEGIAVLENKISAALVAPKYTRQFVRVSIPKFKIESSIDFKEILEELGIHQAFTNLADFSGIAGVPGDILIDKIAQKTYIDVNENGVEAAAATDAIGVLVEPAPPNLSFIADHPFFFYIKVHDIILFEGRFLQPNE